MILAIPTSSALLSYYVLFIKAFHTLSQKSGVRLGLLFSQRKTPCASQPSLTLSLLLMVSVISFVEHPPRGPLAGHAGKTTGAACRGNPWELQGVCQRWALILPRGPHHPSGYPGELHQDHQWATYGHACKPAQGSGQLQPGNTPALLRGTGR